MSLLASALLTMSGARAYSADEDWPRYNRTLNSARYSDLSDINTQNITGLGTQCVFDSGVKTSFQTGLIEVGGVLYGTTEADTFALDPSSCRQLWRVHEEYEPASPLKVNRGLAYMDGRLFRGTQDGRVLAYDAASGKRIWEARIADPKMGETVPAAPLAWDGLVLVGTAGGDMKGNKGRMYALEASSGEIVWEFYLVPKDSRDAKSKDWQNPDDVPVTGGATWSTYTLDPAAALLYVPTGNAAPDFDRSLRPGSNLYTGSVVVLDAHSGAYKRVYPITPGDYHDWDVSTAPALITTRAQKRLLIVAPKDGYLHAFETESGRKVFETPVTRIDNRDAPFSERPVHFCPGSQGGSEWNGPAYHPDLNLVFTGSIEWCTTVALRPSDQTRQVKPGKPWTGNRALNPKHVYGKPDPKERWAGWLYAVDADSGAKVWAFRAPYPIVSGVTTTGGGLVLAGDIGGTLYAFDARTGGQLWSNKVDGAIGGGIITYRVGGAQQIAVAAGMTSSLWPTQKTTAKVIILSLAAALPNSPQTSR